MSYYSNGQIRKKRHYQRQVDGLYVSYSKAATCGRRALRNGKLHGALPALFQNRRAERAGTFSNESTKGNMSAITKADKSRKRGF